MRKGGIISGVVNCTGTKSSFNKPIQAMKKPAGMKKPAVGVKYSDESWLQVDSVPEKAPRPPQTEEQLKESILDVYARHLKRATGDYAQALDMTYHFLKHMLYTESEWAYLQKVMAVMKDEIDVGEVK